MPTDNQPDWGKFLAMGLEMGIGVALGLWIGSVIDRRLGTSPRGALIGCLIGLAGGMYLLIREAIKANRD